jgi:DNA (cytosine-5)-methyltransferase 1
VKYLSVCSGIEAATAAWHPLGWEAFAYSEIEAFPAAVLAHHYPNTPNFGDMTKFQEWPDATIDLLVGGTPCQSFSVAGLRKGLADPRGNLMLTYLAIAARYRPQWVVWENVPGVLSSNSGRDFGTFLAGLGQLGYGFAYRVLDAQYFGVAQRRRRVFVVGCLGDWRRAAAVLFERHSLQGNPAPSRIKGQGTAYGFAGSTVDGIAKPLGAHALSKGRGTDLDNSTYISFNFNKSGNDASSLGIAEDRTDCLRADTKAPFAIAASSPAIGWSEELTAHVDLAGTMQRGGSGGRHEGVMTPSSQVRRLTPRECERLQGFPDDYTLITVRGKPAADGPRYKALGNSMAVPNMRWIGRRIDLVAATIKLQRSAA